LFMSKLGLAGKEGLPKVMQCFDNEVRIIDIGSWPINPASEVLINPLI